MGYKVLIADDEIHICRLVQYLVDWESLGLEVAATVLSGLSALAYIKAEKPDIVVSDIRMSGLSGIELMEQVREAGIQSRFILVSGYKEFEFAKKAIALGVTDYIVKPIQKLELENALIKALDELGAKPAARTASGRNAPSIGYMQPFFDTVYAQAQGYMRVTRAEFARACKLDAQTPCNVYAWHFVCNTGYGADSYRMMEEKAFAVIREQAGGLFSDFALFRHAMGLCLAGVAARNGNSPSAERVLRHCTTGLNMLDGWKPLLGHAQWLEGETLESVLLRARQAVSTYVFAPHREVFPASADAHIITDFYEIIPREHYDQMLSAVQRLDTEAFALLYRKAFALLCGAQWVSGVAVVRFAIGLCIATNQILETFTADYTKNVMHYWDRSSLEQELAHMPSVAHIDQRVLHLILDAMQHVMQTVQAAENRPVRAVKEAVAARYMENLNLQTLAEDVGLNPVYLSSLFKKETGTNFKDYLTKTRIEIAKKRLRDGESIARVTEQVGYHDTKYFSKTFAKLVGVTPSQYRKLFR